MSRGDHVEDLLVVGKCERDQAESDDYFESYCLLAYPFGWVAGEEPEGRGEEERHEEEREELAHQQLARDHLINNGVHQNNRRLLAIFSGLYGRVWDRAG